MCHSLPVQSTPSYATISPLEANDFELETSDVIYDEIDECETNSSRSSGRWKPSNYPRGGSQYGNAAFAQSFRNFDLESTGAHFVMQKNVSYGYSKKNLVEECSQQL